MSCCRLEGWGGVGGGGISEDSAAWAVASRSFQRELVGGRGGLLVTEAHENMLERSECT